MANEIEYAELAGAIAKYLQSRADENGLRYFFTDNPTTGIPDTCVAASAVEFLRYRREPTLSQTSDSDARLADVGILSIVQGGDDADTRHLAETVCGKLEYWLNHPQSRPIYGFSGGGRISRARAMTGTKSYDKDFEGVAVRTLIEILIIEG